MAGSYEHCVDDGVYIGAKHLDHMGDAKEALDHMFFMIHYLAGGSQGRIEEASREFYRYLRGEIPRPYPIEDDENT